MKDFIEFRDPGNVVPPVSGRFEECFQRFMAMQDLEDPVSLSNLLRS